jgi:hypothetical protein
VVDLTRGFSHRAHDPLVVLTLGHYPARFLGRTESPFFVRKPLGFSLQNQHVPRDDRKDSRPFQESSDVGVKGGTRRVQPSCGRLHGGDYFVVGLSAYSILSRFNS